jgi:transposase
MTTEEELTELRAENSSLREAGQRKDEELEQLRQAKQELREGLRQAIEAIESLQERVRELEQLRAEKSALRDEVMLLKGQLAKDSHNSSRPPSSDRFHRAPKSLRKKSGKKPGGQAGHQGHHLMQVDTPDQLEVHPVQQCAHCQQDLSAQPAQLPERRQVIDLPVKRLLITEHRVEEKQCPACHQLTRAAFPAQVSAPIQYGASIQAFAVYLVQYQLVPYARASELLSDLLGVSLSEGTVQALVQQCHTQLAGVEQQIKSALQQARVIHQDETGLSVKGKRYWMHVCSTKTLTHYGVHAKRGQKGMDAIGIVTDFHGTSVHDGLQSYQSYFFTHALCNVHHLRELTFIEEAFKQLWATNMKELLLLMKDTVEQARARGHTELDGVTRAQLRLRYEEIVAAGYLANPPDPPNLPKKGRTKQHPARNLLDRLSKHQEQVLRFLEDFAVAFDNDVIAYCTPSAWLACLLKLTFILVMRVFAGRREQHDPTAISMVHGNAPSSPPIPDRLWRHSIGLSGFSGG